jgi:hypothetical protein
MLCQYMENMQINIIHLINVHFKNIIDIQMKVEYYNVK